MIYSKYKNVNDISLLVINADNVISEPETGKNGGLTSGVIALLTAAEVRNVKTVIVSEKSSDFAEEIRNLYNSYFKKEVISEAFADCKEIEPGVISSHYSEGFNGRIHVLNNLLSEHKGSFALVAGGNDLDRAIAEKEPRIVIAYNCAGFAADAATVTSVQHGRLQYSPDYIFYKPKIS